MHCFNYFTAFLTIHTDNIHKTHRLWLVEEVHTQVEPVHSLIDLKETKGKTSYIIRMISGLQFQLQSDNSFWLRYKDA